jgi:hypothetical protein
MLTVSLRSTVIVWSSLTTRQGATFDRWTLDQHPLDRGTGGASVSWYVFGNVKLVLTDPILLLPPATRGEVATATRGCWGKQTSCSTGGTVNYTSFGPKLVSVMMVDIIGCCRTKWDCVCASIINGLWRGRCRGTTRRKMRGNEELCNNQLEYRRRDIMQQSIRMMWEVIRGTRDINEDNEEQKINYR